MKDPFKVRKTKKRAQPLKGYGIRLDPAKVREAHHAGIDILQLFREALDRELFKRQGKCPVCGKK